MTVRILKGTYVAGYDLAPGITRLDVAASASIGGYGLIAGVPVTVVNAGVIAALGAAKDGDGRAAGIALIAGGVLSNRATIDGATGVGGF